MPDDPNVSKEWEDAKEDQQKHTRGKQSGDTAVEDRDESDENEH
jgi:hypothetical protein